MNTNEKAKILSKKHRCSLCECPCSNIYIANLDMAKWKEEEVIARAIEWLNNWFTDNSCNCHIPITKTAREDFFNDFRKAMKGIDQ